MIGALVFVIGFLVFLGFTVITPKLPPANSIYALLNPPILTHEVLDIPATILIEAGINGAVWGFLTWLLFSLFKRIGEKKKRVEEKL